MSILVTGDPHVWEPSNNKACEQVEQAFSSLPETWTDPEVLRPIQDLPVDCYRAMANAVVTAMLLQCDLVTPGDLVDNALRRGISTEIDRLDRITAGLKSWFVTQGNHEDVGYGQSGRHTPWHRFIRKATDIGAVAEDKPTLFELDGWKCAGIDYRADRESFLRVWDNVPLGTDIVFIHQGSQMQIPFEGAWEICADDLDARQVKVVFAGHIHQPAMYKTPAGNLFVSTGALWLKNGDVVYTDTEIQGIRRCEVRPCLWRVDRPEGQAGHPLVTPVHFDSRERWLIDLTKAPGEAVAAFIQDRRTQGSLLDIKVVYDPAILSDLLVEELFAGLPIRPVTVEQAKEEIVKEFDDTQDLAALLLQVAGEREAHPAFDLVLRIAQLKPGNEHLIQGMIEEAVAQVGVPQLSVAPTTEVTKENQVAH